jgi:polyketide cyclase/dehydrase/lipid transport protein
MDVDVSTSIAIRRPRHEVATFAMDPDNAPQWYVNIKAVEWKTPPPLRVGSQVAFVAQFMGRRLAYTYEIATLIADERLVMRTAAGPFPMETTYEFASTDQGATMVRVRNRGTPSGFSRLMAPFMAMAMRRANRKDLNCLKQILEAA